MNHLKTSYLMDAATTQFRFPFMVETDTKLRVFLVDPADYEQIPLILRADYTVTGAGEAEGGLVRLTAGGIEKAAPGLNLIIKKGAAHQNTGGGSAIISSTDGNLTEAEEVVGIDYLDGDRPIYQKTVAFGAMPENAVKRTPHNISGMRRFWIERAWSRRSGDTTGFCQCYPLPLPNPNPAYPIIIGMDEISVVIHNFIAGVWTNYQETFVTIRYTKESD